LEFAAVSHGAGARKRELPGMSVIGLEHFSLPLPLIARQDGE
jgi:hypothetical protein